MEGLLSVVVPVFNAERYLYRCVQSVLGQKDTRLELVLVDDGSTDGSPGICDAYALQDSRVRVLHKENGGQSSARKAGVEMARGDWVLFADADDWIGERYAARLLSFAERWADVDIVAGSMTKVGAGGSQRVLYPRAAATVLRGGEAAGEMFRQRLFGWHMAGKMYRRAIFRDWEPPEGIASGEDLHGNWQLFSLARKVACCPGETYFYRETQGSITQGRTTMELDLGPVFRQILRDMWPREEKVHALVRESYLYDMVRQLREMFFTDPEGYWGKISVYCEEIRRQASMEGKPQLFPEDLLEFYRQPCDRILAHYEECRKGMGDALERAFQCGGPVYIYGAGIAAKCYLLLLRGKMELCAGCVVSDGQFKQDSFLGHRVFYLSEVGKEARPVFLLAANPRHIAGIREALEKEGCEEVFWFPEGMVFRGLAIG